MNEQNEQKEFNELLVEALMAIMSMQLLILDLLNWKDGMNNLPEHLRSQVPDLMDAFTSTAERLNEYER